MRMALAIALLAVAHPALAASEKSESTKFICHKTGERVGGPEEDLDRAMEAEQEQPVRSPPPRSDQERLVIVSFSIPPLRS